MKRIHAVYVYMAVVSVGLFFSTLRAVEALITRDVVEERN